MIKGTNKLLAKLGAGKKALKTELDQAVHRGALVIAGQAQKNVTGGGNSRTMLNVRTGRLRGSLHARRVREGAYEVGTRVTYARIHEFGGQTAPHVIMPRRASTLAFMGPDGMIFARSVHHPGSKIPARPYLGPAMRSKKDEVIAIIRKVYTGPLRIGDFDA